MVAKLNSWIALFYFVAAVGEVAFVIWLAPAHQKFDYQMTLSNILTHSLRIIGRIIAAPIFILYYYIFYKSLSWHPQWNVKNLWLWLAALVIADLTFYLFHVAAHRWNFLWGTHVVHHQSTDYNISLSGRDGFLEPFFREAFNLPLALIGMPPIMYLVSTRLVGAGMTWIHTRAIKTTGVLELVLNTPSHHRVHHVKDVQKLGGTKNFGGIFIIWDRLFGTFLEESPSEMTEYGVAHKAPYFAPIECQTYYYAGIARSVRNSNGKGWLKYIFSDPTPDLNGYENPIAKNIPLPSPWIAMALLSVVWIASFLLTLNFLAFRSADEDGIAGHLICFFVALSAAAVVEQISRIERGIPLYWKGAWNAAPTLALVAAIYYLLNKFQTSAVYLIPFLITNGGITLLGALRFRNLVKRQAPLEN